GTLDRVVGVGGALRLAGQGLASQAEQAGEVALPQAAGRTGVTGLKLAEGVGDRAGHVVGRLAHGRLSRWARRWRGTREGTRKKERPAITCEKERRSVGRSVLAEVEFLGCFLADGLGGFLAEGVAQVALPTVGAQVVAQAPRRRRQAVAVRGALLDLLQ